MTMVCQWSGMPLDISKAEQLVRLFMILQKDWQKKMKGNLITCCMYGFSRLSSENHFTHRGVIICIALGLVTGVLGFCVCF